MKWNSDLLPRHPLNVPMPEVKPARSSFEDEVEFKVARLELQPGDIIVLRFKECLPSQAVERIQKIVRETIDGHKCLILQNGADIAVLSRSEVDAQLGSKATSENEDAA